jgi:SHS2 domain-containing protein
MAAGKVDVESGFFPIAVTEQHLEGAQVRTRFVEMSGKTMAQRVHMHRFVEARTLNRMVASSPDGWGV